MLRKLYKSEWTRNKSKQDLIDILNHSDLMQLWIESDSPTQYNCSMPEQLKIQKALREHKAIISYELVNKTIYLNARV